MTMRDADGNSILIERNDPFVAAVPFDSKFGGGRRLVVKLGF